MDAPAPPPRTPIPAAGAARAASTPIATARICTRRTRSMLTAATGRPALRPVRPLTTTIWLPRWALRHPQFHAIVDLATGKPVGVAVTRGSIRRPADRGRHINYSPKLQHTVATTEAMYLMMKRAFDLGYRRYEWKCHALNAPSRAAAQRFGFSYEGIFRQARVDKGRNRDTAWYAMIDSEWPALDRAFTSWLDPANFDEQGRQRTSLSALTGPILVARG